MTRRRHHPGGRLLRHADRGVLPATIRLGGRWSRAARPLLVAPVDAVLVRPLAPVALHAHDVRVSVRPSVTVRREAASGRRVERLVTSLRTVLRPVGDWGARRPGPVPSGRPPRPVVVAVPTTRLVGSPPWPGAPVDRAAPVRRAAALRTLAAPVLPAARPGPHGRPPRTEVLAGAPVRRVHAGRPAAPSGPARATVTTPVAGPDAVGAAPRPGPSGAAAVDVDELTRRVVDAIDRRLLAHRERMGGR